MKKQRITVVDSVLTCAYPTIGKTLVVKLTEYDKAIYTPCLASDHGIKQKFGDAASGKSPAEKFAEVQAIHASLLAGEWERTATPDTTSIICEAIARIRGGKFADGKLTLKGSNGKSVTFEPSETQIAEWRAHAKVKLQVEKIRMERLEAAAEKSEDLEIDV